MMDVLTVMPPAIPSWKALARAVRELPSPAHPLRGQRRPAPLLPENIICFQRRHTDELSHPREGRALHHRHVLIVPLQGEAVVCADDRELRLSPGRGTVVLPYQFHHYKISGRPRRIHWLFVTFEYPQGVVLEGLRGRMFAVTGEMASQLSLLVRKGAGPAELRLALLLSLFSPGAEALPGPDAGRLLWSQVNHAVQARRPRIPTVRELASEVGVCASHLRARFKASCGISLGRHVRTLRLERAGALLRMTALRVSEVAEQCGYPSVYSFSRAFRTQFGRSPRAFRQAQTVRGKAMSGG